MPLDDDDRSERLARLEALAREETREMPKLDEVALTTMLANLDEVEKKGDRKRRVAWIVIGMIAVLVVVLIVAKLR